MADEDVVKDESRDAMLLTNKRQKAFYETHGQHLNRSSIGLVNRIWGKARSRMQAYRREVGIKKSIRQFQYDAMGDLAGKRVLDLGCFNGNSMSLFLANSAKSYLGIDLSDAAIAQLTQKLVGIPGAAAQAVDFLSPDFRPERFDLVYANGVMHHFEDLDAFLTVLDNHLVPGGKVITFDPLETSAIIRFTRTLYRPFQKDADWEWPFQRTTFATIENYFEIEAIQGYLGRAKWPIFLTPLFGTHGIAKRLGVAAARSDQLRATKQNRALWGCMQVAMILSRRT